MTPNRWALYRSVPRRGYTGPYLTGSVRPSHHGLDLGWRTVSPLIPLSESLRKSPKGSFNLSEGKGDGRSSKSTSETPPSIGSTLGREVGRNVEESSSSGGPFPQSSLSSLIDSVPFCRVSPHPVSSGTLTGSSLTSCVPSGRVDGTQYRVFLQGKGK